MGTTKTKSVLNLNPIGSPYHKPSSKAMTLRHWSGGNLLMIWSFSVQTILKIWILMLIFFNEFQVLRSHNDFAGSNNPPVTVASTEPRFKLVQSSVKRTVLVLDVSGSMGDNDRDVRQNQVSCHRLVGDYLIGISCECNFLQEGEPNLEYLPYLNTAESGYPNNDLIAYLHVIASKCRLIWNHSW